MKLKRIMAMVLCFAMVLSTMSFSVFAEDTYIAKVGDVECANATDMLNALNAASGEVTVEIYGKLETNGFGINNINIEKLSFVGKTDDAEICVNGVSYIDVRYTNYPIEYTGLILSHTNGTYGNDGRLQEYFSTYNGGDVTYTECTFPNGVTAMGSTTGTTVTFNQCVFNNFTSGKYSLWVDGNGTEVVVNGGDFCGVRGAKLFAENGSAFSTLAVNGATFFDTITEKPAVVLTRGEKVVLEGNTFNNTTGKVQVDDDYASEIDGKTVVIEGTEYIVDSENITLEESAPAETTVATVNGEEFTDLQAALDAAVAGTGNVTVEILDDVNLTGVDWTPVTVSGPGYPVVTVNGNEKTITGLNNMLFAGTWAGGSGLIINDLTIAESTIVNDKNDAVGTVGVGAFIGYPQASSTITLNNCHLVGSHVEGGHWTGGLIGIAGGYSGNDGPVFMNLTIENCSVTGSTITGKGSAGGISGHAANDAWTNVVIENTTVSGNTITSTGSSNNKAGAVMGTIGAAGQPTTTNGVTKTGGASVSATVSGNTVTSGGTAITTIYGRQGTPTGMLYVTGGTYEYNPIEENVAYAQPTEGYEIVQNEDETWGVQEKAPEPSGSIDGGLVNLKEENRTFLTIESWITYANESIVVKVYDANGTLLATSSLIDNDRAILGKENWGGLSTFVGINCTDRYWNVEWEEGKLSADYVPAKATLFVDGVEMNTAPIQMRAAGTETEVVWAEVPGVPSGSVKVATKAELDAAIAAAQEGDTILLTADIDYTGTASLEINEAITLDLGGKTLTTYGTHGGLRLKEDCSIKNGTLNHKGTVAAIKAWNVKTIEDVVIDVEFKAEGKVIGGIVIQNVSTNRIDTMKNVTIKGEGLTNGIETYNCGDAVENVIGSMENVKIDAVGTGMLISAPCGTATDCNIKGGTTGIELWIKGTYSASLDLKGCTVDGGEQALFIHDEFTSNPDAVNNGTLSITADDETTFENEKLVMTIARAENLAIDEDVLKMRSLQGTGTAENPYIINNLNDLKWFRDDVNTYTSDRSNQYVGKYVKLTDDIDLDEDGDGVGEEWEPIGQNTVGDHAAFLGTFDGGGYTISNLYVDSTQQNAGFFASTGSYLESEKAVVKNITFNNVNVYSNSSHVGGVIGNAGGNTYVDNVHITGDIYVKGHAYVGGIVGHGYPKVSNCSVTANSGSNIHCNYWSVGGIVGYGGEGGTKITNSFVKGLGEKGLSIRGASGGAAAICGNPRTGVTAENVWAENVHITGANYASGYLMGNNGGTIINGSVTNVTLGDGIEAADAVASIGDKIYFDIQTALKALKANDTLKLLADVNVDEQIVINKSVTLDLNKNEISSSGAIYRPIKVTGDNSDITVKIENGTITVSDVTTNPEQSAALLVYEGADVTLENVTINGSHYGVMIAGYYGYASGFTKNNVTSLYVNAGTKITAKNAAIIAHGAYSNSRIEINEGATVTSTDSVAIYYPHKGDLIVNGGTITGDTGICIKAGNLTVNGGKIIAVGEAVNHEFVDSGATSTGDAIVVESLDYGGYGAPTVSITDGTIISENGKAVVSYAEEGYEKVTNFISGGTFSSDVTELCAEGFETKKNTNGTYSVQEAPVIAYVAQIGDTYYETFEAALNAVEDSQTITLLDATGDESKTEIEFAKAISFTITGDAPNYALPVVTFQNATVTIEDAEIMIPELDARQDATINVVDSIVRDAGGDSIVKSYYNGAINISGRSVVHTMQVTTMGYITISDTAELNATWQTNVYGNGMITVEKTAKFATAALHLTGQDYSNRDNTDTDRVGKPAAVIVDGATLTVGEVYSYGGADYSYNSSKGINIGTVDGKSAVLDIKNGATVNIYMANGETANIGADGTVNVSDSALNVACRAENGTVTLTNNGTINLTTVDATLTANAGLTVNSTVDGYEVNYADGKYSLKEVEEVELFEFYGVSVVLGNSLELKFYIESAQFNGSTDYYAKIVHSAETGDIEKTIEFGQWATSGIYKTFSYSGIAAKQMTDDVTVVIYDKNDKPVSEELKTSLEKYALGHLANYEAKKDKTQSDLNWMTAMVDMLNYGAAAQVNFGYKEETLANANAGIYQVHASENVALEKDLVSSGNAYATSVTFADKIVFNAYFENVTKDMYAKVEFTDHYGTNKNHEITYDKFVPNGKCHMVVVDKLVIADAAQNVKVTLCDQEGNVYGEISESVNGYLYRASKASPDKEIYPAMARFSASAKKTLAKK